MSKGKAASQAGHAYLGAYLKALEKNPRKCEEYHSEGLGTKVCLEASLAKILQAYERAIQLGIPCFLVTDSGCLDFFDGRPIVTALGIGPEVKEKIKPITGKLNLLK